MKTCKTMYLGTFSVFFIIAIYINSGTSTLIFSYLLKYILNKIGNLILNVCKMYFNISRNIGTTRVNL